MDACIAGSILTSHVKLSNFNGEPGVLPALVLRVLVEEPLLKAAFLHVALQNEHARHETLLYDEIVDLLVLLRNGGQNLNRFLIEVIVLVLCELLPPFLAAGQRHSLEERGLALLEVDVALDPMEGLPEELFTEKGAESSQSDPFHLLIHLVGCVLEVLL